MEGERRRREEAAGGATPVEPGYSTRLTQSAEPMNGRELN